MPIEYSMCNSLPVDMTTHAAGIGRTWSQAIGECHNCLSETTLHDAGRGLQYTETSPFTSGTITENKRESY